MAAMAHDREGTATNGSVEHGRYLGEHIPGADYHEFEGLSHELPPAFCTEIIPLLLAHFAAASTEEST